MLPFRSVVGAVTMLSDAGLFADAVAVSMVSYSDTFSDAVPDDSIPFADAVGDPFADSDSVSIAVVLLWLPMLMLLRFRRVLYKFCSCLLSR